MEMEMSVGYLENLKNGDPDHDYVIDDAIYHIKRAHEALSKGLLDPKEWRADCENSDKTLARAFPILWFLSNNELTSGHQ